ncbi:MAG: hypothetical protein OEU32_14330 [Acidimicrobiia bacterium]|nr:hypothetical protein [Acidimicrobiia bacterium]
MTFDAPGPDGPRSPEYIETEIGRRANLAEQAFAQHIWRDVIQLWDEELKPESIAAHDRLAAVDLGRLDTEGLRDHLHTCLEHLDEMWFQHHRFNCMAMLPVGDFILHAAEWTGRDPIPLLAVFDGWSPVSGVVPPELAPAIAALRADPDARALLDGDAPAPSGWPRSANELPPSTRTCAARASGWQAGSISRTRRARPAERRPRS